MNASICFSSSKSSDIFRCLALVLISLTWHPLYASAEQWTDSTGKHSVEADFVSYVEGVVVLRNDDGKEITIPYGKLSKDSQFLVDALAINEVEGKSENPNPHAIKNADDLESMAKDERNAADALVAYEAFLALPGVEKGEKDKAKESLGKWRERANKKLWRWGSRWVPVETIRNNIEDEDRLIKEAHRLIEIGNEAMARERFEDASKRNPESIRGDFYLGILHALIGQDAKSARDCFNKCVNRLNSSQDVASGIQRANLIASLNNRAICYARMGKHSRAMRDWDTAIEMAPMTPELVQNLGYYAKLASIVSGWGITSSTARRVSEQYATVTVANRSGAFADGVGWLFIPYIDAPMLAGFDNVQIADNEDVSEERLEFANIAADNEFRIASWATAVAVDDDHLLTAKNYVQDAYGLWVSDKGEIRQDLPGRIVAVSDDSNLALIHINGLNAKALPLENQETRRADVFRIVGYPEPGLLGREAQVNSGPIIDISTSRSNSGQEYITRLIYDSQMNRGCEGSALLNAQNNIIGLDLGETRLAHIAGGTRCAISSGNIRSFLHSTSKEFDSLEQVRVAAVGHGNPIDLETSIFQIAIVGRAPRLSWTERISSVRGVSAKEGWNAFEDPWCVICNGIGILPCTERGCHNGQITHREQVVAGRFPATGKPIMKWKKTFEDCGNCNGKGYIECPRCRGRKQEPAL